MSFMRVWFVQVRRVRIGCMFVRMMGLVVLVMPKLITRCHWRKDTVLSSGGHCRSWRVDLNYDLWGRVDVDLKGRSMIVLRLIPIFFLSDIDVDFRLVRVGERTGG